MQITYIGHAGFIVEAAGKSILMDPWFYAANLGSIFPHPDNSFVIPGILQRSFDYLYISHAHTDHFDRRFLEQFDRNVTVLCPSFRSRELEMLMKEAGFQSLIKLGHLERVTLSEGLSVTMLLDSTAAEDSGLMIEANGFRFLDLNDCQVNMGELPEADILACQFSGAIHYPQTYDIYTSEEKNKKSENAVATYVDLLKRKFEAVKPSYFLPSAGPFCFLHPALIKYNPAPDQPTVFLDWERFAPLVSDVLPAEKVLRVFPADVIHADPKSGKCLVEEHFSALTPFPDDTIEAYAERRADETAAFFSLEPPVVTTEEMAEHWAFIHRRNRRLLSFRDFSKSFTIEGYAEHDVAKSHERSAEPLQRWYVTISAQGSSVDDRPAEDFDSEYTFKVPMLMIRKVIDGETNWDEMVASHHMLLSRNPDIFDPQFFALLRYHHVPSRSQIFALAAEESDEMVPLAGDPSILIQRFCPHAGEDLSKVEPCNGVIVCPRHRWEWDLATGVCLAGGNLPLRVAHVAPETAEQD